MTEVAISPELSSHSAPSSPAPSPPPSPDSQPQRECKELLQDPNGTNLFRTYLKGAYASEVLNLWVEIQLYKQIQEHDKLVKKGQFIYEKYLMDGECEVNIDENQRRVVKLALDNDNLEITTFDEIQTQVFDLLWTDCFMGFRHTETYSNYILQKTGKAHHRRTNSAGTHLTDYMRKINFLANRKSLTDSQRNLRTYFDHIKKAPVK